MTDKKSVIEKISDDDITIMHIGSICAICLEDVNKSVNNKMECPSDIFEEFKCVHYICTDCWYLIYLNKNTNNEMFCPYCRIDVSSYLNNKFCEYDNIKKQFKQQYVTPITPRRRSIRKKCCVLL
jgi:hypothetical protein